MCINKLYICKKHTEMAERGRKRFENPKTKRNVPITVYVTEQQTDKFGKSEIGADIRQYVHKKFAV